MEFKQQFDVIVVDPPAFIKRRKDMKEGSLAYRRINEAAMGLLSRDGLLISASCSFHMQEDRLLQTLQQAAEAMICRHGFSGHHAGSPASSSCVCSSGTSSGGTFINRSAPDMTCENTGAATWPP